MMNRLTDVVKHLLIINVIMFIATRLPGLEDIRPYLSLYYPLSDSFKPYQIVTHMFMHASPTHLLFNMMSLFFLGPMIEQNLGSKRFFVFYIICGFSAMLLHLGIDTLAYTSIVDQLSPENLAEVKESGQSLWESRRNWQGEMGEMNALLNTQMLGASGAIMGVFIAFALLYPDVKLMLIFPPIPIKAKYLMVGLVLFDLFSGMSGFKTGIAHFAHLGGAIAGFILITMWGKNYLFRK